MGKNKNKEVVEAVVNLDFPRTKFRLVKQMDHMTMKRFLENVYMQGFVEALEKAEDKKCGLDSDAVIADISKIKGIGEKKLSEIAKIIKGYLGGAE